MGNKDLTFSNFLTYLRLLVMFRNVRQKGDISNIQHAVRDGKKNGG